MKEGGGLGTEPRDGTGRPSSGDEFRVLPPPIALPKGGGAIRGIGEKFAANPVTGTGSISVPIVTSPGRSGFGPQLSLSYDSGGGNGIFGYGWGLALPSITRKTDKGLPQYLDDVESDVFILSGAEDLVPAYRQDVDGTWVAKHPGYTRDPDGSWVRDPDGHLAIHEDDIGGYRVRRYRPRVEGLFARIERWSLAGSPNDAHWRSISKDNILTVYGLDASSRIADPLDDRRIFTWLICETRDDKGNGILYRYEKEDGRGVNVSLAHERNRGPRDDKRRTANRYVKRICYGNRTSLLDDAGRRPRFLTKAQIEDAGWMFEVVFDYGEHDVIAPTPCDPGEWDYRPDPFSSYRAGFEVRTTRLCQRVLMFHHFPGTEEDGVGVDCLVRSTDFTYSDEVNPTDVRNPVYTFLRSVTQTGYRRDNGGYDRRRLPPVEFEYTEPIVQDRVEHVDRSSLENLPIGLDGTIYRWTDLHGGGIPGILSEQAGAWFYKRNVSPVPHTLADGRERTQARLTPVETVTVRPNVALGSGAEIMDLAGDGQPDVVTVDGPTPGLYEHDDGEGWQPFRAFTSRLTRELRDPNARFVDLSGDGHADLLITEDDAFVWHASVGEQGFSAAQRVAHALDEEHGPRIVFADGTESIYLADLSGDGLTDIARIRNGDVCYWPNIGYGRFGAKVAMDNAPWFDHPDQFAQQRVRVADIDGSGTTDIIYLHRDGVRLYFNQSGNSWSEPNQLQVFPRIDDIVSIVPIDLLGNGTACLVWSSPLPDDQPRPMRYVNLMGDQKPHLLIGMCNNLGAETRVDYAPSTKFYLQDERDGHPWITRLPFPVHVVERVEAVDQINRTRFVTRYRYRDGHYDEHDREFRGFAVVEQEDAEQLAALTRSTEIPTDENLDPAHHLPPVRTRTWFHTGAFLGRDRFSRLFAEQYYPPPEHLTPAALDWLLDDTPLAPELPAGAEREACRALKGRLLRQEVYALDGTSFEPHPYTVVEHNYSVRLLQAPAGARHGVFAVDPRETITATCERNPEDARVAHEIVIDVDPYGTVLHSLTVAYGRRTNDATLPGRTVQAQATTLITETRTRVTNRSSPAQVAGPDTHRVPVPYDTRVYQLAGRDKESGTDWDRSRPRLDRGYVLDVLGGTLPASLTRRLIARDRVRFDSDDLAGPLPWGVQGTRGLLYETYRLALPETTRASVFEDRVTDSMLESTGYVNMDGGWWKPSGTIRYTPESIAAPHDIIQHAAENFFNPRRFIDPFAATDGEYATTVEYDQYNLLPIETIDPTGNRTTAGRRDGDDRRIDSSVNYRVLAPKLVTDPNRNRTAVAYDALAMIVATAVMGKPEDDTGDRIDNAPADLTSDALADFWADPRGQAATVLGSATTRLVYDVDAYTRTRATSEPQPTGVATIARERHVADPPTSGPSPLQIRFGYANGAGQQLQRKLLTEPDPTLTGVDPKPPRWTCSGWTVQNNKGTPIRQYEPFFTPRHTFEFAVKEGVSPVMFYDPLGRVVATLHPNGTYDKIVTGAWHQRVWDVNDTAALPDADNQSSGNPSHDPDIGHFTRVLSSSEYLPTWYQQRIHGGLGQDEQNAAMRSAKHTDTPTLTTFDPLGRPILALAHNRTPLDDGTSVTTLHETHAVLDIVGNQLEAADTVADTANLTGPTSDRTVACYRYDLTGARIAEESMEAGAHRQLVDVAGNTVEIWEIINGVGAERRLTTTHDRLRRPVEMVLQQGTDTRTVQRVVYGEVAPNRALDNQRTRVWRQDDGAGRVTCTYDIEGNPTSAARTLVADTGYRDAIDWAKNHTLAGITRKSRTIFDAFARPREQTHPDGTIVRYRYNAAGLLDGIDATLANTGSDTTLIRHVEYNAKGQRTKVVHGNGVATKYDYDPETFRLATLHTVQESPRPSVRTGWDSQNLSYVYDPVGNVTHIADAAQPLVFRLNTFIDARADYTYDALYRLVTTEGREHLGIEDGKLAPPTPTSATDGPRINPTDRHALGRYHEHYTYDLAGNLTLLAHRGTDPQHAGWTRTFAYNEASQIMQASADIFSNRLTGTRTGKGALGRRAYEHDARGNMTVLPPLQHVRWNYLDELCATSTQRVGPNIVPETTYYCYDRAGRRVRWVRDGQAPTIDEARALDERIYIGDFELYRRYTSAGDIALERTTVHIMDGDQRVALIETRVDASAPANELAALVRYQYGNHVGSVTIELDGEGELISHEEYYSYGGAALGFWRDGNPPKRYRYTSKERDSTGLYYHGARYYAPWLSRWASADPAARPDALNPFTYNANNPTSFRDPNGANSIPMTDAQYAAYARWQTMQKPTELFDPGIVEDSTPVLRTMPDGTFYVGGRSPGERLAETIASNMAWARTAKTLKNIAGGPGGAIGSLIGGDVGSDIGNYVDTLLAAAAQRGKASTALVNPALRRKDMSRAEWKAQRRQASGASPIPVVDRARIKKAMTFEHSKDKGKSFEDFAMDKVREPLRSKYGDRFYEPEKANDNQPGYYRKHDVRPEAMIWGRVPGEIDAIIDAKSGAISDLEQGKGYIDLLAQRGKDSPPGYLVYLIPEGGRPTGASTIEKYAADKPVIVKFKVVPGWTDEYAPRR